MSKKAGIDFSGIDWGKINSNQKLTEEFIRFPQEYPDIHVGDELCNIT